MPDLLAKESLERKSVLIDHEYEYGNEYDSESDDSDNGGRTASTMSMGGQKNEYSVLLIGAAGCGKSALVSRFMDKNVYLSAYHETLVDNYTQLMFMLDTKGVRNRKVNLHI